MPLVAPVWGVGKTPWVLVFVKVSKLADRPLDTLHNVPLLPAPTEEGGWTNRSTSTQEAKKWLLSVLSRALDKDPEMTAIHCLKSTALSWAGKAGLSAETRQSDSLNWFFNASGLDLSVLPDASISGMITEPTVEDPSKSFRREESESESSESSSTDSSSDAATLHSDQYPEDVWPNAWEGSLESRRSQV